MRILARPSAIVLSSLALVACGSGSGAPGAGEAVGPDELPGPAPEMAAATVGGVAEIEIGNYALVSSTRVSRTMFDYTYVADASNWSDSPATLSATLASSAATTVVVDGELAFGVVARGDTVQSADTFTIRQDRSQPYDPRALHWTVQADPLAPTTYELIDAAQASGAIGAETALLYKVFYEFGDDRLPAEYRGRPELRLDAPAFQDAVDRFDTLSQATRDTLRPFTLPPDDPAGWYGLQNGGGGAAAQAHTRIAAAPAAGERVSAASVGPVEDVPGGAGLKRVLVQGRVYVYWNDVRYPDDAGLAFTVADAIDQVIWPRLTGLLGQPPYDSSGILDVRIANSATMAAFYRQVTGLPSDPNAIHLGLTGPACHPSIPVVYLNRDPSTGQRGNIAQTAAHEIAHAILARFPLSHGCADRTWLAEATATWAEHHAYPNHNTEHPQAPRFLDEPALALETKANNREYGAYLWFLFATRGDATGLSNAATRRVPATWAALAGKDSLGAVDEGVASLGGLESQWPLFALYNWNRVVRSSVINVGPPVTTRLSGAPYVFYGSWDGLRASARESTTAAPASGLQPPKLVKLDGTTFKGFPLAHRIQHLGAKYWHFDFSQDPNIRRVRLTHPYFDGSEPTAKVQVIWREHGRDWSQATTQDWTGYERRTICRDNMGEDFDEFVVVISDSEFHDRNQVLDDSGVMPGSGSPRPVRTFVEVSAFGCTNWEGSVDFTVTLSGGGVSLTETGHAGSLRLEKDFDRFTRIGYKLAGGSVVWHHAGNYTRDDGDSCEGESDGQYDLVPSITGIEWIGDFGGCCGFTPPVVPAYNLYGRKTGVPPPDDYVCTDAQEPYGEYPGAPLRGHEGFWLNFVDQFISPNSPTLYEWDPLGNELRGTSQKTERIATDSGDIIKRSDYVWKFTKGDVYPGEPEL